MEKQKIISLVTLILLSLSFVSAYGVSRPYWDKNPLNLAPGESMTVRLDLQNMAGEKVDRRFKVKITDDGGGIAKIIGGDEFLVPFGREDIPVSIQVSVPKTDQRGGIRNIALLFSEIGSGKGGMMKVSGAFTATFPVNVVAPEKSVLYKPATPVKETKISLQWILLIALILVVIISIIVVLIIKKKRRLEISLK